MFITNIKHNTLRDIYLQKCNYIVLKYTFISKDDVLSYCVIIVPYMSYFCALQQIFTKLVTSLYSTLHRCEIFAVLF